MNSLINKIAGQHGRRIVWADHKTIFRSYIDREGFTLFFQQHGNTYAQWIEFTCYDSDLLCMIKKQFPEIFKQTVKIVDDFSGDVLRELNA